jgi:hypothetical protein
VVSKKIAKHSKSFGEGEFIKDCLVDVASIICPEKKKDFENICLSRRTVVRRIEMMADDIKKSLKEKTARLEAFSIVLDDSTDASDTAKLATLFEELMRILTSQKNYWLFSR